MFSPERIATYLSANKEKVMRIQPTDEDLRGAYIFKSAHVYLLEEFVEKLVRQNQAMLRKLGNGIVPIEKDLCHEHSDKLHNEFLADMQRQEEKTYSTLRPLMGHGGNDEW